MCRAITSRRMEEANQASAHKYPRLALEPTPPFHGVAAADTVVVCLLMRLLPPLCMATGDNGAAAGEGDSSNSGSKQTAVSSSSSTVSTSSSAAAAAVSEASSSMSLPSLPSLSAVPSTSAIIAASFAHVTTLCPLSTAAAAAAASAAAVAAADSVHGGLVIVARPAAVALHDVFTMEATSTSDMADAASAAGSVKCVAHLHGGKAAVTGHQDGRLRLWRVSSRAPDRLRLAAALPTVSDRLRRFPVPSNHVTVRRHHRRLWIEHADAVSGVAASADSRLLFSVSWDKTLKVWAVPSLRCLQSLPAHDDAVNAVAVAPDGTVYTASADRRVRVWAPRPAGSDRAARRLSKKPAYHLVATLSRHGAAVNAVAVGCGGQVLYSGGNDRCVVVWEREDSASHMVAVGALRGHRKAVLSVACGAGDAADGALVVSGSADQTVRAWRRAADGRGYACVAVIDGHGSAVRSVAVAFVPAQKKHRADDDGDEDWRVCSASFDGEVRLWSLRVAAAS